MDLFGAMGWCHNACHLIFTSSIIASINIPCYTQYSYSYWSQGVFNEKRANISNSEEVFSYIPIRDRSGFLLIDGYTASSIDGTIPVHKNDNTNITYHGPSYGEGSSMGLVDDSIHGMFGTIGYCYNETGYKTKFQCIVNLSLQFSLYSLQRSLNKPFGWTPYAYFATGLCPGPIFDVSKASQRGCLDIFNGYQVSGFGGTDGIVAFGW